LTRIICWRKNKPKILQNYWCRSGFIWNQKRLKPKHWQVILEIRRISKKRTKIQFEKWNAFHNRSDKKRIKQIKLPLYIESYLFSGFNVRFILVTFTSCKTCLQNHQSIDWIILWQNSFIWKSLSIVFDMNAEATIKKMEIVVFSITISK
jgi:hypothetical protein